MLLLNIGLAWAGKRDLIVILDWDAENLFNLFSAEKYEKRENGYGLITYELIAALEQEAAPIIVSSATWRNVFERRALFHDAQKLSINVFFEKYKEKYSYFKKEENTRYFVDRVKKFIAEKFKILLPQGNSLWSTAPDMLSFWTCSVFHFNPAAWDVYKISPELVLAIPKKYIKNIRSILGPKISNYTEKEKEEFMLGLHLPEKKIINSEDPRQFKNEVTEKEILAGELFVENINAIFVHKEKLPNNFRHKWYFYITGHGASQEGGCTREIIADMSIDSFKNFLQFCKNAIDTEFLFYATCYAGGTHLITEEYPFYMAAGTYFALATWGREFTDDIKYDRNDRGEISNIRLEISSKFNLFFKELHNHLDEPKKIAQAISYVHEFIASEGRTISTYQPVALKPPGKSRYVALGTRRLSHELVEYYEENAASIKIVDEYIIFINTQQFLGSNRYHTEIYVPVIIRRDMYKKDPVFLTDAVKGDGFHYFEKIDAQEIGCLDFFQLIMPIKSYFNYSFFIKELVCKNDIERRYLEDQFKKEEYEKTITLLNVVIKRIKAVGKEPEKTQITFELDGSYYSFSWRMRKEEHFSIERKDKTVLRRKKFPNLIKVEREEVILSYEDLFQDRGARQEVENNRQEAAARIQLGEEKKMERQQKKQEIEKKEVVRRIREKESERKRREREEKLQIIPYKPREIEVIESEIDVDEPKEIEIVEPETNLVLTLKELSQKLRRLVIALR